MHQLVAAGEVFALVAVRRGERTSDALQALWKDELCELVALGDLDRREAEDLLEAALGAPIDGRSLDQTWRLTLGNPMYLRELVRYGSERGALADDGGIWRWRGEMGPGMRLVELVGARLEKLDEMAGATLELVAVGAPLEVDLLDPDERAALETLEQRGVVERRADGRRRAVDFAHPLYGDVVRARTSRMRTEAIQRRLADAVEAWGARRRGDVLRVAAWRLESGAAGDPALFERAAAHALAALDVPLAQRLAHAAVEAGGDFDAQLLLGRALAAAGRAGEADELLHGLEAEADGDERRAAVAVAAARNLLWGLDRPREADEALSRAEAAIDDAGVRGELVAQRVRLMAARGRPREALAAATALLGDETVREPARVHAAVGAVEALLSSGRLEDALALADTWLPAAARHCTEAPQLGVVLASERGLALRLAGRLVEATEASQDVYERRARPALGADHGRGGDAARLQLARAGAGPDRAAPLSRERGADARRGRGRDASDRAGGSRAGICAGGRTGVGAGGRR